MTRAINEKTLSSATEADGDGGDGRSLEEICHTDVGVQSRWWAVIALCDVEAPFLRATSAAD